MRSAERCRVARVPTQISRSARCVERNAGEYADVEDCSALSSAPHRAVQGAREAKIAHHEDNTGHATCQSPRSQFSEHGRHRHRQSPISLATLKSNISTRPNRANHINRKLTNSAILWALTRPPRLRAHPNSINPKVALTDSTQCSTHDLPPLLQSAEQGRSGSA